MTAADLTQEQKDLVKEYEKLTCDHSDISHRLGTDGERGLYPTMKSIRSKMSKINKKLATFNLICRSTSPYQAKLFILTT